MKVTIIEVIQNDETRVGSTLFERKHEGASCIDVTATDASVFTTVFESGYRLTVNIPIQYRIIKSVSHSIGEIVIFVKEEV